MERFERRTKLKGDMKMVEEKEEENTGPSLGALFALFSIVMIMVVGFAVFQMIMGPYATADNLRDVVNSRDVTDDYRQGWLDCVEYWLDMTVGPQNATAAVIE